MGFRELGIDSRLLRGIEALGFDTPTHVQIQTIPAVLKGGDVIVTAQTGTGKTAAYLLPLIHRIIRSGKTTGIKAMVVVPTRELALQIDQMMDGISYFTPVGSTAVYGGGDGMSFERERNTLAKGPDIVICTPGRMITHLNMKYLDLSGLEYFVLDEADRMLDIGFYEDIMKIVTFLPKKRQTLLLSATIPPRIKELSANILKSPVGINIGISKPPEKIIQKAYIVYESQKAGLLKYLLKDSRKMSILVFCSTRSSARSLARELKRAGLNTADIHSDLDQTTREEVLLKFKNRKTDVLVATDILSRGIDIEDIDIVINYDVPNEGEDYIHRVGRTARAESDGTAITFITGKEQPRFAEIEKLLGKTVTKERLPDHLGKGPEYKPDSSNARGGKPQFRKFRKNTRDRGRPQRGRGRR
ncbi:MAG: DEAD/DEAH box helicase [Bacteroidetes bacterium]|nr:DEAD/DEAH box helicase [Bacteroidota bacterium]